jgi:hypothetical protein
MLGQAAGRLQANRHANGRAPFILLHPTKGAGVLAHRFAYPFLLTSDRESSRSVLAIKYDDQFRRLGFVGR